MTKDNSEQESFDYNTKFKETYPKAHWFGNCSKYKMFGIMCNDCCTFNVDFCRQNNRSVKE